MDVSTPGIHIQYMRLVKKRVGTEKELEGSKLEGRLDLNIHLCKHEALNKNLKTTNKIEKQLHSIEPFPLCSFWWSPLRRFVVCGECYHHVTCHGSLQLSKGTFGGGG